MASSRTISIRQELTESGVIQGAKLLSEFAADQAGGFATPNLSISGLTSQVGPLAGGLNNIAQDVFDPSDFFNDVKDAAKLFGTLSLADLLQPLTMGAGAPKVQFKKEDLGAPPPSVKLRLIATLDWTPEVKDLMDDAVDLRPELATFGHRHGGGLTDRAHVGLQLRHRGHTDHGHGDGEAEGVADQRRGVDLVGGVIVVRLQHFLQRIPGHEAAVAAAHDLHRDHAHLLAAAHRQQFLAIGLPPRDRIQRGQDGVELVRHHRRPRRHGEHTGPALADAVSDLDDAQILAQGARLRREKLHQSELHPDGWGPIVIREPAEIQSRLAMAAGDKYSYRELDEFTDIIARTVLGAPQASKADRSGVLPEVVYLYYSQERLASYDLQAAQLKDILGARNITLPGGVLEIGDKNLIIDPSGQFTSAEAMGDVIVGASSSGSPVYLRDVVEITRGYQSPPQFLNYHTWRDASGKWHRSRAVTLAIYMRSGEQIAKFGRDVDEKLAAVRQP